MKIWLTNIGQKPFAAVNALWAAEKENKIGNINKVIVLYSKNVQMNALLFQKWASLIFANFQSAIPPFVLVEYPENDISNFRAVLKKIIVQSEGKIMMDMTSGKKAMAGLMLLLGDLYSGKVNSVFYMHLRDYDYMNFPFVLIPHGVSQLYNLLEDKK